MSDPTKRERKTKAFNDGKVWVEVSVQARPPRGVGHETHADVLGPGGISKMEATGAKPPNVGWLIARLDFALSCDPEEQAVLAEELELVLFNAQKRRDRARERFRRREAATAHRKKRKKPKSSRASDKQTRGYIDVIRTNRTKGEGN